jgi:hypothetical protein
MWIFSGRTGHQPKLLTLDPEYLSKVTAAILSKRLPHMQMCLLNFTVTVGPAHGKTSRQECKHYTLRPSQTLTTQLCSPMCLGLLGFSMTSHIFSWKFNSENLWARKRKDVGGEKSKIRRKGK